MYTHAFLNWQLCMCIHVHSYTEMSIGLCIHFGGKLIVKISMKIVFQH